MVKKRLHALAKNKKMLIGVVVVVVLVLLYSYFKVGKVSREGGVQEEETPSTGVMEQEEAPSQTTQGEKLSVAGCTDTDGGKKYGVKGEVNDIQGAHDIDRCSRSDVYPGRLYEAYCADDGTHARDTYDCPSGVCEDGACV